MSKEITSNAKAFTDSITCAEFPQTAAAHIDGLIGLCDRKDEKLEAIYQGHEIVMPSCKGHAQNMLIVAKRWLKDNA